MSYQEYTWECVICRRVFEYDDASDVEREMTENWDSEPQCCDCVGRGYNIETLKKNQKSPWDGVSMLERKAIR